MSLGPIPFTAITEYFSIYPIGDNFEEFHYIMRSMDDVIMAHEASKVSKNSKTVKNKPGESASADTKGSPRNTGSKRSRGKQRPQKTI